MNYDRMGASFHTFFPFLIDGYTDFRLITNDLNYIIRFQLSMGSLSMVYVIAVKNLQARKLVNSNKLTFLMKKCLKKLKIRRPFYRPAISFPLMQKLCCKPTAAYPSCWDTGSSIIKATDSD